MTPQKPTPRKTTARLTTARKTTATTDLQADLGSGLRADLLADLAAPAPLPSALSPSLTPALMAEPQVTPAFGLTVTPLRWSRLSLSAGRHGPGLALRVGPLRLEILL